MDIFQSSYYVRCYRYLSMYGHWPSQSLPVKIRNQVVTISIILTIFLPQCSKLYEVRGNLIDLLLIIPNLLYQSRCFFKNLFALLRRNEIKKVLDEIQRDFQLYEAEELEVLKRYAKTASTFNTIYAAYMFSVCASYSALPFAIHLMDLVKPLNETRLTWKPRLINYHVDALNNNTSFGILHGMFVDLLVMVLFVGIDTLYINMMYHACALFEIVAKRVRRTIDRDVEFVISNPSSLLKKRDSAYKDFVKNVVVHQYVLDFVGTMESAFSTLNLITISGSVIPLAIVGFLAAQNKNNPSELLRYILFAFAELAHLFSYNWPGEQLRQHGLLVHDTCYDSNWYEIQFPVNCRKSMNLMMLRSQRECVITAGKIYELGLKNFAAVVKVAMSYITVLSSIT